MRTILVGWFAIFMSFTIFWNCKADSPRKEILVLDEESLRREKACDFFISNIDTRYKYAIRLKGEFEDLYLNGTKVEKDFYHKDVTGTSLAFLRDLESIKADCLPLSEEERSKLFELVSNVTEIYNSINLEYDYFESSLLEKSEKFIEEMKKQKLQATTCILPYFASLQSGICTDRCRQERKDEDSIIINIIGCYRISK